MNSPKTCLTNRADYYPKVSIISLSKGHIRIVQSTLLGSILSNILLVMRTLSKFISLPLLTLAQVLGMCFLAGGIRHNKQSFNSTSASTMSSLVAVTLASIIIPATLYAILHASSPDTGTHILFLSRGAAILLLMVYMVYLYFQLKFGANFLDIEQGPDSGEPEDNRTRGFLDRNPILAFLALLSVTFVMTINAIYFVDSIEPVASSSHFSRLFIGFILIPMVGMAADPATAFNIAYHNRIDLAINIAIRRSVQIALFVTPFMVILGWAMNKKMTLHFQGFETVVFFLSLCEVSYLVQDGKSKHLASAICIGT
jgi:Ca2+:H+ antiporter